MTSLPSGHRDVSIVCADGVIRWNSLAIRMWTTILDEEDIRGQSSFTIICPDFKIKDVSKVMESSLDGQSQVRDRDEMEKLSNILTGFGVTLEEDISFVDSKGNVARGAGAANSNKNRPVEQVYNDINNNKFNNGRKRKREENRADFQKELNDLGKGIKPKKRKKSAKLSPNENQRVLTPKEAKLEQKIRRQLEHDESETTQERNGWLTQAVEHVKGSWKPKQLMPALLDCSHYKNVEQFITMIRPMNQKRSGFPPETLEASNTSNEYLVTLDDDENVDLILKKFPKSNTFGIRISGKWVAYPKQNHPDFVNKSARILTNTWWIKKAGGKASGVEYDGFVTSYYFKKGYGPWGWRNKTVAVTYEEGLRHCPNHHRGCPQYSSLDSIGEQKFKLCVDLGKEASWEDEK